MYSVNAEGVAGPRSPSVVVHTLLETPPPPIAPPKYISSRKLLLTWKVRNHNASSRDKAVVERMLVEWAGSHSEVDGGVSIEKVFQKYDRDSSGTIDSAELAVVLTDLGIEVTEEHLSEAFKELDENGDGVISFDEFSKWWRREEVLYTIKRSEEVTPLVKKDTQQGTTMLASSGTATARDGRYSAGKDLLKTIPEDSSLNSGRQKSVSKSRPRSASAVKGSGQALAAAAAAAVVKSSRQVGVPIVSYRGSKNRCEVAGLTPNRLYHFRLRFVGSRSPSMLSAPLIVMTTPLAPSAPILIEVSSSLVRLKWYASDFGCYKFNLQLRLRDSSDDWSNVYNGFENTWTSTTLSPDSCYEARCFGLNFQGTASEPSDTMTFSTLPRKEGAFGSALNLTAKGIGQKFNIECTADICVGDTILITERLFVRHSDSGAQEKERETKEKSVMQASMTSMSKTTVSGSATKARSVSQQRPRSAGPRAGAGVGVSASAGLGTVSLASTQSAGVASITAEHGEFVGERTIAAFVCKDNYRTLRDKGIFIGESGRSMDASTKRLRTLWLEVVWQRGSSEACKPFELKMGEVLERQQIHLEQFEVFRAEWKQEKLRRPLLQEWITLQECFIPADS